MEHCVGYAAVTEDRVSKGSLPKEASIFTAELWAIKTAINEIVWTGEEGDQYTIFSDSRSALQALRRDITLSPLILEIKEQIHRIEARNIGIEMCWVPGHVNITGNEKADAEAKEAAMAATPPLNRGINYTDMKRPIREAIFKKWQEDWNSLNIEGRKLREIKQEVRKWKSSLNKCRRIETALSRLRVGHTNITHSYLMQSQANPPECERCRQPITVKHLLLECRKYASTRNKLYNNPSLSDMLAESSSFDLNKIISFLRETDLLSKI